MKLNEILNQKKLTYIVFGIIIILASVLTINALISGTKHSPSNILVNVDGYTMTLQEAIGGNYLKQNAVSPSSSGTTSVIFGHSPSEIWVSVDGVESTLAAAIAADNLCGSTSVPYTGSVNPGHLASEIEITVGGSTKTLQQAIDGGDFCCVPLTCAQTGCGTHSDGCGGTLNCGACPPSQYCGDGTCNNGENYNTCATDCTATYGGSGNFPRYYDYYMIGREAEAQLFCTLQGMTYVSSSIGPGEWGGEVYCRLSSGGNLELGYVPGTCASTLGVSYSAQMPVIQSVTCGWSA